MLLSRWIKPVRIVPNAEVAQHYAELLQGTDVQVPDNVVPPALLEELRKAGVPIRESGKVHPEVRYSLGDTGTSHIVYDEDGNPVQPPLSHDVYEYFQSELVNLKHRNYQPTRRPNGKGYYFQKSNALAYVDANGEIEYAFEVTPEFERFSNDIVLSAMDMEMGGFDPDDAREILETSYGEGCIRFATARTLGEYTEYYRRGIAENRRGLDGKSRERIPVQGKNRTGLVGQVYGEAQGEAAPTGGNDSAGDSGGVSRYSLPDIRTQDGELAYGQPDGADGTIVRYSLTTEPETTARAREAASDSGKPTLQTERNRPPRRGRFLFRLFNRGGHFSGQAYAVR